MTPNFLCRSLPLLIGLGLVLLSPSDSLAQAGTVRDSSVVQAMMPPFNQTISPQGTYTHGNSTYSKIEVQLGTMTAGQWTAIPNQQLRTASTGQAQNGTLTWSAAAYQNLAAGSYRIRATLSEGYGNPPIPVSVSSVVYGATLVVP